MLTILLVLQLAILIALVALLLRKPPPAPMVDPRLAQLPDQLTRVDARSESLDQHVRAAFETMRRELAAEAQASRAELAASITELRNSTQQNLEASAQRLTRFSADTNTQNTQLRESLNTKLNELMASNTTLQERLRTSVEERLNKLNSDNSAKLEEMRQTVDEKLHATLQTRLTESFGAVTDQLTKVHAGLGEMTKLSAGVDDLSRIFTNVKSRGTIGEVMLETLLKQMLAPNQYQKDARVKPNTQEMVEFAVKLPTPNGEALLPIDSKFPREIWERLEAAYSTGDSELVSAGKAFETAIRNEGKKICEKYICPPTTTSFAIMFLPTEGLYAEVMRRDGLQADIQQNCRVTIAGPSTLSAILSSFQMGFHMLELQQKGDEVWKVLANARSQFGKFEDLMTKMDDQVSKVQNTIQEVGKRTRVINRTLRDVSVDAAETALPPGKSGFDGVLPLLAASEEE